MIYNKEPKFLGCYDIGVKEMFSYTYLPVKFPKYCDPKYEERLKVFDPIIGSVCCDFIGEFGLDKYVNSYIYVTAKNLHQKNGNYFNRGGYHSDGFGTDDINYIWSNNQPTVFNHTNFDLSSDDQLSLKEMEEQALSENDYTYLNNSLLRMDQFSIHKVSEEIYNGVRCFLKISFSKDKYDLVGNSHNYKLDYRWNMRPRSKSRNVPQIRP